MAYYELTPAYGRDYKTKQEVIAAFENGKDFEGDYQLGFKPVNIDDIRPLGGTVNLRYSNTRKVAVYRIKK